MKRIRVAEPADCPSFCRMAATGGLGQLLELGCGTGALTSAIRDLAIQPRSSRAIRSELLRRARSKAPPSTPGSAFIVAGAGRLAASRRRIRRGCFRAGPQLPADPDATVAAIRARLRRGGTVAGAYVWDYAEGTGVAAVLGRSSRHGPACERLDEGSVFRLRGAGACVLFERAGLRRWRHAHSRFSPNSLTFADYRMPFLRGTGPAPSYVASLITTTVAPRARLERRLPAESGCHFLFLSRVGGAWRLALEHASRPATPSSIGAQRLERAEARGAARGQPACD